MSYFKGKNNPKYKNGLLMSGNPHRPIHNTWQNMKARCYRKTNPKYNRYGGRGITVCEEWLDKDNGINNFYRWSLNNGWSKGLVLDRINNDGNYEPSNCQWISIYENSRKKSTTKISYEEAQKIRYRKSESMQKLAKEYNVSDGTIWFIINNITHIPDGQCSLRLKEKFNNK